MKEETNQTLNNHVEQVGDSWEGLITSPRKWLKAEDIKGNEGSYICTNIDVWTQDNQKPQLILHLETKNDKDDNKYSFGCNRTNTEFIAEKFDQPKKVIGCVITFHKVKANNPKLKKEVDALRIKEIV